MIERDLDVIADDDLVINLGPEGAPAAAVATSPPEALAVNAGSHTVEALPPVLARE